MKLPGTLIMSVLNTFANDPLGLQPLPPTKPHHLQLKEGIRAMLEPTPQIPMSWGGAKRDTNRKPSR
jgi:hypothetical protein